MLEKNRLLVELTVQSDQGLHVSRTQDGKIHWCFTDSAISIFFDEQVLVELTRRSTQTKKE